MEQSDLLRLAIETLEELEIPYALVGSFASGVWGESRFTQDIDIVIQVDPQTVESLCAAFSPDEFYVSRAAALDAVRTGQQFNVIHPASGNKIDFMIASNSPWGRAQIDRRRRVQLASDLSGDFAAPEDVILGKLIYYNEGGSEKHLRDITGILRISGETIDREYLTRFAQQLGLADLWQQVVKRLDNG